MSPGKVQSSRKLWSYNNMSSEGITIWNLNINRSLSAIVDDESHARARVYFVRSNLDALRAISRLDDILLPSALMKTYVLKREDLALLLCKRTKGW